MFATDVSSDINAAAEADISRYNNFRNIQKIVENVMVFLRI